MSGSQKLTAIVALLASSPVLAHDFFIAPSIHRVTTGEAVTIVQHVGSETEMDELPRSNRRIVRFEAHLGDKVQPVEGKHGESPSGRIAFDSLGDVPEKQVLIAQARGGVARAVEGAQ